MPLIEKAYCLSLDKKLPHISICMEFGPYNINVEQLWVGDGKLFPHGKYFHIDENVNGRKQAYNYAICIHKIVYLAQKEGFKNFLFLEDDATLTAKFSIIFPKLTQELEDIGIVYDMLFLGGNHKNGPHTKISNYIIKPTYSLDLHAVIFSHTIYDIILSINPSTQHTFDGMLAEKQRRGLISVYACHPSIITQKPGFSFNENRIVDRSHNHWI